MTKNKNLNSSALNARYLTELSRIRAQAERQGRPEIANAFAALIEKKQALDGGHHVRGI